MKLSKKIIATFLAVIMAISVFPVIALADEICPESAIAGPKSYSTDFWYINNEDGEKIPANYSSNIVYTNMDGTKTDDAERCVWTGQTQQDHLKMKFVTPGVVVGVYDGVTKPSFPIVMETNWSEIAGNGEYLCFVQPYANSTETWNARKINFRFDWYGASSDSNWNKWPVGTNDSFKAEANAQISRSDGGKNAQNSSEQSDHLGKGGTKSASQSNTGNNNRYWRNSVEYNGSFAEGVYSDTITNADLLVGHTSRAAKAWIFGNEDWYYYSQKKAISNTFYVINYQPLYDILKTSNPTTINVDGAKNIRDLRTYLTTGAGSWMYTEASRNTALARMAAVGNFDLKNYNFDYKGDTASAVNAAANDIKTAYENYTKIPQILVKDNFTVNFKTADGSSIIETKNFEAGTALGTIPANSGIAHIANTNTHNVYTWDSSIKSDVVVHQSTDYLETATPTACSFTASVYTPATESKNGYTTKTCACGNETVVYDTQDFKAYDDALDDFNETVNADDYTAKYTAESRTNYQNAVNNAKINKDDVTLSPTAIAAAATEIAEAKSNLGVAAYTITYVKADNTQTTQDFPYGTAASVVETAAPALVDDYDENAHYTYEWDKAFADVTGATTYTLTKATTTAHSFTYAHDENSAPSTHTGTCTVGGQSHTTAPEACTFVNGEHVAASGEANGYTEKVCSVCQFVDDAQKVYDNRDTSAYTTAVSDYEATKAAADYADFTAESKTAYETAVNAIIAAVNTDDQTKSTEYYNNRADEIIAANELLELPAPENTYNLTIEDTVEVNFNIDTEFYQAQGGTIEYSYLTTTGEESAERTEKVVQVDDIEEAGMSKITIEAAPAQIAEPYVITVKDSQGEVIDTITTSIQTYCHEIMDGDEYDQKDKDVAKALLNYGALANEYFSYADISEAVTGNEYIVDHTSDWKDAVDAESFKAKAKASFTTGADASGANVSITGISYVALLDPEFRFYVSQTNEVWAALTEVTVLEGEEGLTAKMFKNEENGKFCVVVKGLKASDFGKTFKIQIGEAILEYNGYAYLYTALRTGSTADEGLQNLAKGVYRYAAACEAKFA